MKIDGLKSAERDEIVELMRSHHDFRVKYEAALRKFPDPWPAPIADRDDMEAPGKRELARQDYLSITLPFHAAYWPRTGQTPSAGQKQARMLSERLAGIMQRLRDHLARYEKQPTLPNYPLANFRLGTQSPIDAEQILKTIDRHLELLLGDLRLLANLGEILGVRIDIDLHAVLKEARHKKRHTQREAAAECGVDGDTYKSWELGRSSPSPKNRKAVQLYIIQAFGLVDLDDAERTSD